MFWLESIGGVWGEFEVVDKLMLRRSIMSCSFVVVLTGVGGSGRANAPLGLELKTTGVDGVALLLKFNEEEPSPVPADELCIGLVLVRLHS